MIVKKKIKKWLDKFKPGVQFYYKGVIDGLIKYTVTGNIFWNGNGYSVTTDQNDSFSGQIIYGNNYKGIPLQNNIEFIENVNI